MSAHNPLVIGIAGGSGSGKTTVAQTILQRVGPDRPWRPAARLPSLAQGRLRYKFVAKNPATPLFFASAAKRRGL